MTCFSICLHNSLVGARINPWTRDTAFCSALLVVNNLCNNGNENATVLPDPVLARTRTSFPCKAIGIHRDCTNVGYVYPNFDNAMINLLSQPKSRCIHDFSSSNRNDISNRCCEPNRGTRMGKLWSFQSQWDYKCQKPRTFERNNKSSTFGWCPTRSIYSNKFQSDCFLL